MPLYIADHKDQEALGDLICSVTVGGVGQSRMRHDGQQVIVPLVDDERLNDGKAGPLGYVGKTATKPLYPWF